MHDIYKKISYLKGYADGLKLDEKSSEGKVLLKIIDILNDLAEKVGDIECNCDEIASELDVIEDDLELYGSEDYDDEEDADFDDADDFFSKLNDDDDDENENDDEFFEIECPNCGEDVLINFDDIDNGIICPHCNEEIELEFDSDDEPESED
ncbi:MAG: hypothetical protein J6N52_10810 [Clostridia bacterium]|nr:hypothetical protein [Clostridia bacterium]